MTSKLWHSRLLWCWSLSYLGKGEDAGKTTGELSLHHYLKNQA